MEFFCSAHFRKYVCWLICGNNNLTSVLKIDNFNAHFSNAIQLLFSDPEYDTEI